MANLFLDPTPVRRATQFLLRRSNIGSFRWRYRIGALHRMYYGYIVYQAAQLAAKLGQPRISVLEFGVAGGNGLLWMERHAEQVERIFNVEIEVYGFDTGVGLPEPADYRDLPYHWQKGFFAMDPERLKAKLKRAKLVFGDVADTCESFLEEYNPAPIAAVSHDLDFYSSTMAGLKLFDGDERYLMPRIFCYFDDVMGGETELYSDYTGERLAIEDFNNSHTTRKIGVPYYLRDLRGWGDWVNHIWVFHAFEHSRYNSFVSGEAQQIPLIDTLR